MRLSKILIKLLTFNSKNQLFQLIFDKIDFFTKFLKYQIVEAL